MFFGNYTHKLQTTHTSVQLHTQVYNYTHKLQKLQTTHTSVQLHTQAANYTHKCLKLQKSRYWADIRL